MRSPTRDRQIISILTALVLHSLIVLLLGLVDLDQEFSDDQRLGPVAVRFEPLPELVPPQSQPDQPEQPQPQSQSTAAPLVEQAPQAQAPQAAPQAADQPAAEEEWTIPTPTGSNEAPPTERRRRPSPQTSEQAPAAESLEGRQERSPASATEQQWSKGERIVYGEQEQPGESGAGRTRDQSAAAQQPEQESAPRVFSDELRRELESVESTGAGQPGRSSGETAGSDRSSGQNTGPAPAPSDGSSPVEVELEGQRERKLQNYSLPKLSPEELEDLPPQVVMVVSFVVPPSGRPQDLKTDPGSGNVTVDRKVMQAVRTWKFEEAQGAEPVNGRARIVIRAAD